MPKYFVEIKPSALKELESLPDHVLARVISKVTSLGDVPRPAGCKKLKGSEDKWRIRIADWRVIYIIDDAVTLISVTRVAHRSKVYEG